MSARIGLARKIARNLLKRLNINTPPIRLSLIVKALKCEVFAKDLNDGLSGIQISVSDECFILYNKNQHVHRKRFTVAHEIGHFILGHGREGLKCSLREKHNKEIEANQFAAELLMPRFLLKKEILKGVNTVESLALRFWVSKEAMAWRLLETGFYKRLSAWD